LRHIQRRGVGARQITVAAADAPALDHDGFQRGDIAGVDVNGIPARREGLLTPDGGVHQNRIDVLPGELSSEVIELIGAECHVACGPDHGCSRGCPTTTSVWMVSSHPSSYSAAAAVRILVADAGRTGVSGFCDQMTS